MLSNFRLSDAQPTRRPTHPSCIGRGKTSPDPIPVPEDVIPEPLGETVRKHLFDRFSLLRSTAFRMGAMFWLLFTACFGIAEYAFYEALQDRVLNKIDVEIAERFVQAQEVYNLGGVQAIVALAEARSNSPMRSSMGFHLSTPQGERIAGNVPVCLTTPGWDMLVGEDLGLTNDTSVYRFYTASIGGNVLSLGRSLDDLVELRKIAVTCLIWTAVISTLLAVFAAWIFARRIHRRVTGVSVSLDSIAAGNLDARLPVSCAGDDIDEFAKKINTSLDRLRQTVDSMRQVSTDIAHDLKTPLNRLFITIEGAATKSRKGQCVGDELDGALDEAQAISATFEALLRIAQIEAGARRSQFKHIDLSTILDTAVEVYAPVVEEHCQELVVNLQPGQSLPMFGDKSLMMQLIVNLIENAVHHCSDNTLITLSAGEDKDSVWFRVADSGPGIPELEREKVFQRLYRLERSRTTKGTGLGLSLVKAIADLHCGTITLEDNKPGLAVFIRFERNCASQA